MAQMMRVGLYRPVHVKTLRSQKLRMLCEFCPPIEMETGWKEDLAVQLTEGWILGCSPTVRTQ
jgi:hypothetical protein